MRGRYEASENDTVWIYRETGETASCKLIRVTLSMASLIGLLFLFWSTPNSHLWRVATAVTAKLAISIFTDWALCFCLICRLAISNSTKEAVSIMNTKKIVIGILAVLFVFPLLGAFAQQAASSSSIE